MLFITYTGIQKEDIESVQRVEAFCKILDAGEASHVKLPDFGLALPRGYL